MTKRLYFLLPNQRAAEQALARLRDRHGLDDDALAFIARDDIELAELPEADPNASSDFMPALARGSALGGSAGLVAGVVAVSMPPAGLALGGGAVLALTGLGAAFGAWVSALVGASVPHTKIQEFQKAIENGEILLMVDVDEAQALQVVDALCAAVPGARCFGDEAQRASSTSLP